MQPATYASVAHVGWERSIRWEAPDDDDAAERAAPVVGGDARVASGAWTRAIRWDGDQTAAPSDEPTPAPADDHEYTPAELLELYDEAVEVAKAVVEMMIARADARRRECSGSCACE